MTEDCKSVANEDCGKGFLVRGDEFLFEVTGRGGVDRRDILQGRFEVIPA